MLPTLDQGIKQKYQKWIKFRKGIYGSGNKRWIPDFIFTTVFGMSKVNKVRSVSERNKEKNQ